MKNPEILLPFSIPPAELQKDLQKDLRLPAFSRLIGRSDVVSHQTQDHFCKAVAHEAWLSCQFPAAAGAGSPPIALNHMSDYGLQAGSGHWFVLEPVHIHIARDHLVLTDKRLLALDDDSARALFAITSDLAREEGMELLYGDAQTWFLRADGWRDLLTATSDAACGHNIDIWMPAGDNARAWRKLQNEIQMHWFTHDINQQREQSGLRTVNSVWLHGGATERHAQSRKTTRAPMFQDHTTEAGDIILLDSLISSAINNDWGSWLEQMEVLERDWFAPALAALQSGRMSKLDLVCTDAFSMIHFRATPWSLKKFWRSDSVQRLFGAGRP